MSEQLGLLHVSKGEGCERRIEVFKMDSKPWEDIDKMNSVASNSLSSSDFNITEVSTFTSVKDTDVILSHIESCILNVDDTEKQSLDHLDEHVSRSQQPSEEAVERTRDMEEHVGMNDLTETAAKLDETSSTMPMLCCSNCGQQIPQLNYQLHSLHCKTSAAKSRNKKSKDASLNKVTCFVSSSCKNI